MTNETRRRITKVIWRVIGIISFLLLAFFALNAYMGLNYPRADRFEVGRVASGHQSFTTWWPYGRGHQLILDVPGAARDQPPAFTASIQFLEGNRLLTNLVFHSTNARPSQWPQQDSQGFFLDRPDTNWWQGSLTPGRHYSMNCDFVGVIPSNSTLWVWCIQTGIDRWKTKRSRTTP